MSRHVRLRLNASMATPCAVLILPLHPVCVRQAAIELEHQNIIASAACIAPKCKFEYCCWSPFTCL